MTAPLPRSSRWPTPWLRKPFFPFHTNWIEAQPDSCLVAWRLHRTSLVDLKKLALENLDRLERVNLVTKSNNYQDMLNAIGRVRCLFNQACPRLTMALTRARVPRLCATKLGHSQQEPPTHPAAQRARQAQGDALAPAEEDRVPRAAEAVVHRLRPVVHDRHAGQEQKGVRLW